MEWNWNNMQNQNAQAAADAGQRAALENELKQNEARIAELKAQLQQNRTNADELDRKLAANRAGIGDTGTALAHQRAIDDRAQRAAMNAYAEQTRENEKASLREGQKKKLIDEIEQVNLALADPGISEPQKAELRLKKKRLESELAELGGVVHSPENPEPTDMKTGMVETGESVETYTDIKSKLSTMKNLFGRVTKAQKDELLKDLSKLPLTEEGVNLYNEIKGLKTEEQHGKDVNEAKRKANAALDKVEGNVSEYELNKNGGKITKTIDGLTVTIERDIDGSIFAKCGTVKRHLEIR